MLEVRVGEQPAPPIRFDAEEMRFVGRVGVAARDEAEAAFREAIDVVS